MNAFNLLRYVPLPLLRGLARGVAFFIGLQKQAGVYQIIDKNLQMVYPKLSPSERKQLAHATLCNQAMNMVESVKSWAMPAQWSIGQIRTIHNEQALKDGLANPYGMLAIVPHLGTWEVMNPWLNQFGSPTIMYKPVKGETANAFALQGRERLNATLVPTDSTGVKAIFKTLKAGGFSIILPDHVPDPSGGVTVPFFGIDCLTSTLAPKLASKTRCSLVGLTCVRRDDNTGFDIYCDTLDDENLYNKDVVIATTALNQAMEGMINRFPAQYMWGYKRFKNVLFVKNPYKLSEDNFQEFLTTLPFHNPKP